MNHQRAQYNWPALIALAALFATLSITAAITTRHRQPVTPASSTESATTTAQSFEPLSLPAVLPQVPDARQADTDTRFVALVNARGMWGPRSSLVFDAHHTCDRLRSGVSWSDVVDGLVTDSSGVTQVQASYFVATAVAMYC